MSNTNSRVVQNAKSEIIHQVVFNESGVDLTLIREYLKLTPVERLRSLQNAVRALGKFRRIVTNTPR